MDFKCQVSRYHDTLNGTTTPRAISRDTKRQTIKTDQETAHRNQNPRAAPTSHATRTCYRTKSHRQPQNIHVQMKIVLQKPTAMFVLDQSLTFFEILRCNETGEWQDWQALSLWELEKLLWDKFRWGKLIRWSSRPNRGRTILPSGTSSAPHNNHPRAH